MKEMFNALENDYTNNTLLLKQLENLYEKDRAEVIKWIFLKLNDKSISKNNLLVLLVFIQQWYPFDELQEKIAIDSFVKVLKRVLLERNDRSNFFSTVHIIFDIIWHNATILEGVGTELQNDIGEILSFLSQLKYDLTKDKYDDLYLALSKSILTLGYLDKSISDSLIGFYKNHFDNRIAESYSEYFVI